MSATLPPNWSLVKLGDVCDINPKPQASKFDDELTVSFLPMKAVEELSGRIDLSDERKFNKVKKRYTFFGEGDVIFAKITPCMENGKIAITTNLKNGIGFGSTEFHVLRPKNNLLNEYLFHFLTQHYFRKLAQRNMTGTAGQLRVPKKFIEESQIPLPPLPEQKKIVEKIEELFSGLDSGIAELKKVKEQIKVYRQSVLAAAFGGKLTQPDTGSERLNGIQEVSKAAEPAVEYRNGNLPEGWRLVKLIEIAEVRRGKSKHRPRNDPKLYNGNYPFIQTGEIRGANGGTINSFTQSYNDIGLAQSKLWPKGTLCISIAANIGESAFLGFDDLFP